MSKRYFHALGRQAASFGYPVTRQLKQWSRYALENVPPKWAINAYLCGFNDQMRPRLKTSK